MEVLVYNKGCIREDIATQKLRRKVVESGHTKTYNYHTADVIVYITCAGLGDVITECLR